MQQRAFDHIKERLTCSPALALFDPNLETIVAADASSYGLGAVLQQKQTDGVWKPIAFISRSMSPTEQRYIQIEKEALAFTWACKRLSNYLIGLRFHIQTDHKPLVPLFSTKHLDELLIKVQRFRLRMMRFEYTISHVRGADLVNADTLSRAPALESTTDVLLKETEAYVNWTMKNLPATDERLEQIKKLQRTDEACQLIATYLCSGWPDKRRAPAIVKPYLPVRAEFFIQCGLLMRGSRILIPPPLPKEILNRLHTGHQGITKCQEKPRQSVWWPRISTDLEELMKRCTKCCKEQVQRSQPMTSSQLLHLPWQKVGTDFFEWDKHNYVLVVDYYSHYIEIARLSTESAQDVINKTKSIFARHGIPETVMSDNGPQYTSKAYENFAKEYQFNHLTSSPYYPQSNGEAERAVCTIKGLLKKCEDSYLALLFYRMTPIQGGKYSPIELLMNKLPRSTIPTTLELRKPRIPDPAEVYVRDNREKNRQKQNYDSRHGVRKQRSLIRGELVWLPDRKQEARVRTQVAPQNYTVTTADGTSYRRNRRDIVLIPEPQNMDEQTIPEQNASTQSVRPEQETAQEISPPQEPRKSTRISRPPDRYAPVVTH